MKNTPLPLFLAEDFPLPVRFGDSLSPLRFLPPDLPGDLSLPPLLEPDERIQYNHNKKQTIYSVRFGGRNRNASAISSGRQLSDRDKSFTVCVVKQHIQQKRRKYRSFSQPPPNLYERTTYTVL